MPLPTWTAPAIGVLLIGTSAYSLYDVAKERRESQTLAATNQELRVSLAQMQSDLQRVTNKLNDLAAPAPAARPAPVKPRAKVSVTTRRPAADPRWAQMQAKLADQQKQLDSTREAVDKAREDVGKTREDLEGKLSSTRDDLSGSIAKNHDELVALQKRGERNYYEFRIDRAKQFQKVGPLSVSLRKVNFKHKYYDLALMIEDQQLEKKHVNLYEPMMISVSDRPQPLELVVNQIRDNQISGYVSEPKYKKSELISTAAQASPESNPSSGLKQR